MLRITGNKVLIQFVTNNSEQCVRNNVYISSSSTHDIGFDIISS